MRLFWEKSDEMEYKAKLLTEDAIINAPAVKESDKQKNSSANLDNLNIVIDSQTAEQMRKARKLVLYCNPYNGVFGWTYFIAVMLLWCCKSTIDSWLHSGIPVTAAMAIGFSLALFHFCISILPTADDGLLLQLSRSQPQLALPILAKLCGIKRHRKVINEAKRGFCIVFEKLGLEKCASLLCRRNRQQLYNGLILNETLLNAEGISPDDSAYCEAVLSLLEQHPEASALQGLENLPTWAPWPLVERGRLIAMRVEADKLRDKHTHQEKTGTARLLYDLGRDDLTISQNAVERLCGFNQQEIAALLSPFAPREPKAFTLFTTLTTLMYLAIVVRTSHSLPLLCQQSLYSVYFHRCMVRLENLYDLHKYRTKMLGPDGLYLQIPWSRLIETLCKTDNLEIVHELLKIPKLIGGTSAQSRTARDVLTELLPRVSQAGTPVLNINHLHAELERFPYFSSTTKYRFQMNDYRYFEVIVGVLALQGNEDSLKHIRNLYHHLGFANIDQQDTKAIAKQLELEQDELKSTRLRLQMTLSESYCFLAKRIGAGYMPGILLRASSVPVKSDTLLRPAGKGAVTAPEELLRPTENDETAEPKSTLD